MRELELLAPARNADIGIAAIDCGADAVYMAGPGYGARQAAGNSIEDVARVCEYAHRYGARVFATVNTIIFDSELDDFAGMVAALSEAGVDALIVQDMAVPSVAGDGIPLHASTQCAIRTPQRARELADKGFSRLILERELSKKQISEIAAAIPECEIECFVHGALCVCYSGNCYLSENISGRSANRGACIQACRSRYDLVDKNGKVLVKDKALLSLKDLNLSERLGELAEAGVMSFKIEGRLKNESYVRNVVRQYSLALDAIVAASNGAYCRASWGRVDNCFTPAPEKTFNRGYTELFFDGRKESGWAAMDAAKGMGELIGKVITVKKDFRHGSAVLEVETAAELNNGDGFSFVAGNGDIIGFRGDSCDKAGRGRARIVCKFSELLYKGAVLYRNLDSVFEKEIARSPGRRMIDVDLDLTVDGNGRLRLCARSEDGRMVCISKDTSTLEEAMNHERIASLAQSQLCKIADIYSFRLTKAEFGTYPLLSAAFFNTLRRETAEALSEQECIRRPLLKREINTEASLHGYGDYRDNAANRKAASALGRETPDAYELSHLKGAELMRSRYCIRCELGICPKQTACKPESLYLLNNGRRLRLDFDCAKCEMVVRTESI